MSSGDLPVLELAFPGPLRDSGVAAILAGEKTALTGLLQIYEHDGEPVPQPGQRFSVIDSNRDRRPGLAELRRLQHLRDLLTAAGHDASEAVSGLFSTAGFTDDLTAEATASRGKILLVTLGELYEGRPLRSFDAVPARFR